MTKKASANLWTCCWRGNHNTCVKRLSFSTKWERRKLLQSEFQLLPRLPTWSNLSSSVQRAGGGRWTSIRFHLSPADLLLEAGGASLHPPRARRASYTETLHVSRSCCLGTTTMVTRHTTTPHFAGKTTFGLKRFLRGRTHEGKKCNLGLKRPSGGN